jgi:hypothetical protein
VLKAKASIKERAEKTKETPVEIISSNTEELNDDAIVIMPEKNCFKIQYIEP